ncbi:MAG: aldehyde ferredoxin oxidoreductase [Deltaproteobacteria bacterium]|nr:MAG: aldehyde ferredoxin oxidoreductase [Deltaproteobacteria bacterium]
MARFIRVDMSKLKADFEEMPDRYRLMGGRWLTSSIISDEVDPLCHPLGKGNKIIFAPGIVTGTGAPTCSRISVGAKSPLTGGIKESNAGTKFSQRIARLGVKAIIVEGKAEGNIPFVLEIKKDSVDLVPAKELSMKGAYETMDILTDRYGDVGICCIGPAGEMKMAMAGICFNDLKNKATRYAGRGGLGAVMGAKGLKAIVVDDKGASGVEVKDNELFEQGRKKLVNALQSHDITKPKGALNTYGTAVLVNIVNNAGAFPVRNFSGGRFENADKVSGEAIFKENKKRTGKEIYNHACSPGCIIQCSNTWYDKDGKEMVSCQEYESIWALGPNCGIDDLDVTGELIRICNDLGIDTIEAGVTLGVAMETGLADFGDGKRAIELLKEIGKASPIGRILGQGAAFTGRAFGVLRVPAVKGQAMPAYEPRAVKGIGITYITSTMGADHTSGYTIAPEILSVGGKADPLDKNGKVELSRNFQITTAFLDSTGYCLFIAFAVLDIPSGFEGVIDTCNAILGTSWGSDDVVNIGKEILRKEKDFNIAAGVTKADGRIPEFIKEEQLSPHSSKWDIEDKEVDGFWEF